MDELAQWCEIDGHEWKEYWVEYGMMTESGGIHLFGVMFRSAKQHTLISRTCTKCGANDNKILVLA